MARQMNHLGVESLPEPPRAAVKEVAGGRLVVGGGLAGGLSVAGELAKLGFRVTVVEASRPLGGAATRWTRGGSWWMERCRPS